ncbi:hypothetical protein SAMN05660649_02362 [Desulfotomaculum arcticum]|uniref:Uncharacterized protein n=1 Tax=Desulfotruncus arcticus DSM 17038 TaxID=1121424 RepID=A0A1I2TVV3_9FIRM|nr:hypothetical protein SAMN05660649_02362 [Desulfotomaculum arcticum] [Desulfotruncus arcticus DSM 17038]
MTQCRAKTLFTMEKDGATRVQINAPQFRLYLREERGRTGLISRVRDNEPVPLSLLLFLCFGFLILFFSIIC